MSRNEIELNKPDYDDNEYSKSYEFSKAEKLIPTQKNEESNVRIRMKKSVGLIEAIALIIGCMIGSGIFSSPRSVAKNTGSVGLALTVWAGAGLIAIFGALCYTELGTMIRESGGERQYLEKAFGEWAGFLFAWTSIVVLKPASLSAICVACGEYIVEAFNPGCGKLAESSQKTKLIAAFVIGKLLYLFYQTNIVLIKLASLYSA